MRLLSLNGVIAEVGIDLDIVNSINDRAVFNQRGPEGQRVPYAVRNKFVSSCGGFVIELDGSVLVEGEALARSVISVDNPVADHDSCIAEAVVIAVDGEDGVIVLGNTRGCVRDALSELVVCECGSQCRCTERSTVAT